jgi:DNA-binding transcriptional ArsR family regulator
VPFRLASAPAQTDLVAKYFRGLGDPTRLRILELLHDDDEGRARYRRPSAQALVERVSTEVGIGIELKPVNVVDPDTAAREGGGRPR